MNHNEYLELLLRNCMNHKYDSLLESHFKTTKIDGEAVEIFKNPDSGEVDECVDDPDAYRQDVRGVIMDDTKDLFIWRKVNGGVALHANVINDMDWSARPYLPIVIETSKGKRYISFTAFEYGHSPLRKKYPYDPDEGVSSKIEGLIRDNPNVKSLGYKIG